MNIISDTDKYIVETMLTGSVQFFLNSTFGIESGKRNMALSTWAVLRWKGFVVYSVNKYLPSFNFVKL